MQWNEEFMHRLDLIFAYIKQILKSQQDTSSKIEELFAMVKVLNERMPYPDKRPAFQTIRELPDWIDAHDAKELIKGGYMTLRRRRLDGTFEAKKIGKKWFYRRSSLQ